MAIKENVEKVAQQMKQVGMEYDKLFDNFGIELYEKLSTIDDEFKQVEYVNDQLDEILEAFALYFPNKTTVACQAKCSHCCSFSVFCPLQTIEYIAQHIEKNYTKEEIDKLIVAFYKTIEQRKTPQFRAVCSFLDEEGCCSIYEIRPLVCRWFTSPDASLCERSVYTREAIPQQQTEHRIFQLANSALALSSKDKEGNQVEFIPAMLKRLEGNQK